MLSKTFPEIIDYLGTLFMISAFLTALVALIPALYTARSKDATRKIQAEYEKRLEQMTYEAEQNVSKHSHHTPSELLKQHEEIRKQLKETTAQYADLISEHEALQHQKEDALQTIKQGSFFEYLKTIYSEMITAFSSLVIATLSLESLKDTSKARTNTVVGMMLKEKLDGSNKNCLLIIAGLIAYICLAFFNLVQFHFTAFIIPLCLLVAMYLDQHLIIYRVKKGWYGRNEYETREIINYVIAHAKPEDFNNDGGLKTLMDKPERKQLSKADNNGWAKA
ncbi:hypothetical protein [Vibrio splendidus]|uniref:hypothetical protein n=1 Tax=Vibrio splendidus TaxID=29497 RepID=UPI002468B519|nr:hypothetical protein [Vibrio splendidus]MDH6024946.1 hypothetical protein [Vibrio splendidus]